MKRELVNQVRELLERNLSTAEIAHRMGIDLDLAKMAIDTINQLLTRLGKAFDSYGINNSRS
jgi:orotate phosphoribosyltransferase-like protein